MQHPNKFKATQGKLWTREAKNRGNDPKILYDYRYDPGCLVWIIMSIISVSTIGCSIF